MPLATFNRREDIKALLQTAREQLSVLKNKYENALAKKDIDRDLKIGIKNYLENLRSALDYIAHDIHDHFVDCEKGHRIYFPIQSDESAFISNARQYFHNLQGVSSEAFNFIEAQQAYRNPEHEKIVKMFALLNRKKHDSLTPQTKNENVTRVEASREGSRVSWNPRGVTCGQGVSMLGSPVDPATQLPVPNPAIEVKKTVWVSFSFDAIEEPVFPFLDEVFELCSNIAANYESLPELN